MMSWCLGVPQMSMTLDFRQSWNKSKLLVLHLTGINANSPSHASCFLGMLSTKMADPRKTAAISAMKAPSSVTELRRFMGMVNQMSKFSPNIAQISKPLHDLLSTKNSWVWSIPQEESFRKLKEEISSTKVLALYDVMAETKISADASAHGLGAVLL